MKAVILDAETLGSDVDLTPIHSLLENLTIYGYTEPGQLLQRLSGCSIAITNKVQLPKESLKGLKAVFVLATGVNNIDTEAAKGFGVAVFNVSEYGSGYVAQHTWMLILALAARLPLYQRDLVNKAWQTSQHFCLNDHITTQLTGKNLVLQGSGSIGQKVAAMGSAMGMAVHFAARPGDVADRRASLESLLPIADVLSFHCPMNENTRALLNETSLKGIKQKCLVVNCARGGIIDEIATLQALRGGQIGGLAVDVLPTEPPRDGHGLLQALGEPLNLIVTPHNAWIGPEARQRIVELTAANIKTFLTV